MRRSCTGRTAHIQGANVEALVHGIHPHCTPFSTGKAYVQSRCQHGKFRSGSFSVPYSLSASRKSCICMRALHAYPPILPCSLLGVGAL
jgi:hypothetical protein